MRIWIGIESQTLDLYDSSSLLVRRYPVSTAAKGAGEIFGSFQTPRGRHIIRAKVGAGQPENTVFVRRRPTGEIWTPELAAAYPGRDWILTRILWLSGCDVGFNRLGCVDTMRRYVYLHGSPDTVPFGVPGSIGCIRMRNRDIMELFDRVPPYTPVDIGEYGVETGAWEQLGTAAGVVRETVFVHEQGVPADMEYDEHDPVSVHAVARGPGGEVVGTGRLLPDGHIGRMAVLDSWRGKGVGSALMAHLINAAHDRGTLVLRLNAQTQALDFYRRFEFVPHGEVFMEAGIPHLAMERSL